MNVTPQPYAGVTISVHKTDDPDHANYINTEFTGAFVDCVAAIILAMKPDANTALMIELAVAAFHDQDVQKLSIEKLTPGSVTGTSL